MPVNNWIDYSRIPTMKQDYSGSTDFVKNMMEAAQRPFKMQSDREKMMQEALQSGHKTTSMAAEAKYAEPLVLSEIERNKQQGLAKALEMAILQQYGGQEAAQKIALMRAQEQHYNKPSDLGQYENERELAVRRFGEDSRQVKNIDKAIEKENSMLGRGGLTESARVFNGLPKSVQAEQIATAAGYGFDPLVAARRLSGGDLLEDLQREAEANGVDTNKTVPIFSPNAPTVNAMHKRSVLSAGSEVLDKYIEKGQKRYSKKYAGYSPLQMWDHIRGDKVDELSDFYASRMLEDENAVVNVAKSGGQVNMHAVDNMITKGMGNTKVIPSQMNEEVYAATREKARHILKEMMEAERNALSKHKIPMKADNQAKAEALTNASKPLGQYSIEELQRMRDSAQ